MHAALAVLRDDRNMLRLYHVERVRAVTFVLGAAWYSGGVFWPARASFAPGHGRPGMRTPLAGREEVGVQIGLEPGLMIS
jgi:hypothetical protein